MHFEPLPVIQKLELPVLLLYGEIDLWVPIDEGIKRWQEDGPSDLTIYQIKDTIILWYQLLTLAFAGMRSRWLMNMRLS